MRKGNLCVCGSSKDFQVCCAKLEAELQEFKNNPYDASGVMKTLTNEPLMMIRICYNLHNLSRFKLALKNLKCIDFLSKNKFAILYKCEAEQFGLSIRHNHIAAYVFPMVLSVINIAEHNIYCDIRSVARAINLVSFFSNNMPKDVMSLDYIEIENRLFKSSKSNIDYFCYKNFNTIFARNDLEKTSAIYIFEDMSVEDDKKIESQMSKPFPKIERICLGIDDMHKKLAFNLTLRCWVASDSFENKRASTLNDIFPNMSELFGNSMHSGEDKIKPANMNRRNIRLVKK